MGFAIFETSSSDIQKFYSDVIKKHETYAPVESFGRYKYERVKEGTAYQVNSPIHRTMSIKPLFFPPTNEVLRFKENRDGVTVLPPQEDPLMRDKVVLGGKMCDAQAMKVLENVAKWDYVDEDFLKRRANTILIVQACEKAGKYCFCSSLDFSLEGNDAADVLVVNRAGGKCLVKATSEKGQKFLQENHEGMKAAPDDIDKEVKAAFQELSATFQRKLNFEEVHRMVKKEFESPEFDEIAKLCISCNTCSFTCPTCHCFKMVDEKVKETGVRFKCYDACANHNFTLMAGGHNPRPEKRRRWRQRAMHKFVYYKERFGTNLCVGCGRCVSFCPVNINIFDVVTRVGGTK